MNKLDEESRFSRWSRRKQQTLEASQKEDLTLELEQQVLSEPETSEAVNQESDLEEVLTDADMPPIETLNPESDFSVFMSSGVTDKLRNLALRQLYKTPSFNIRDGLDEYDEDYTFFEKLGDTVTCDMRHGWEMEAKKKQEEEESAALENETEGVESPEDNLDDIETVETELTEDELGQPDSMPDPTVSSDEILDSEPETTIEGKV
jgi:hypothetical protein